MSISPVANGHSSATQQVQQALNLSTSNSGVRKAAMGAGAKALGITRAQLQAALANGQSLASISTSRGVSIATLTALMGAAVSKANPSLSSAQALQTAQRMVASSGSGEPSGATQTSVVEGH